MWISTRAQYGLRALIEIGRQPEHPVALKAVASRQGISLHYLEQIVANLRRAGFVRSVRGAKGGYQLAHATQNINAYDVVVALEGSLAPVDCVTEDHVCEQKNVCGTLSLWKRVDDTLREVLGATTLHELINEADQQEHERLIQLA